MRFLLFNLVVAAAILYLVTGDDAGAFRWLGLNEATTEKIVGLRESAVKKIEAVAEVAKAKPTLDETIERSVKRLPQMLPKTKAAETKRPAITPPARPDAAKPKPVKRTRVASKDRPMSLLPEGGSAQRELPPIPDAKWVETRKVHMTPQPGSDRVGEPIPADPAVRRRRAEVLGGVTQAKKFALKDGEAMMSPSDRLRELGNLADEMELLYFSSLGN